jgi:hypothetical protein
VESIIPGSLIRIKEGCGEESGRIGIVMSADSVEPRFFAKVLIEGCQTIVSIYWLEVISGAQCGRPRGAEVQ